MAAESDRWNSLALQSRSLETQQRILAASDRLFRTRGIESTSMQDIADESGRSIGSLYHHFGTKDSMVNAVVDQTLTVATDALDRATEAHLSSELSLAELVRSFTTDALAMEESRPGWRQLCREASTLDPETRRRYVAARKRTSDSLYRVFRTRQDEIGHPQPDAALRFAIDQLIAMISERTDVDRPAQLADADDATFTDLVFSSIESFLRLPRE